MKPEQRMWVAARPLFAGLDPVRVENAADPGTPDVNYALGWVELKQLPHWPRRANTPVKVRLFTTQQRAWLRRRCAAGGDAWLLLRVGQEWLLFWGDIAAQSLGRLPRQQLKAAAYAHWDNKPTTEEFQTWLLQA